jgi:hypothetical protein
VSENTKNQPADSSDPSGKYYASHVIGISRPEDELGPMHPDESVDPQALEDGVEPDYEPGGGIFVAFAGLAASLVVIGIAVGSLVVWMSQTEYEARIVEDPLLTSSRAASEAYLNVYEAVEGSGTPSGYRVPVEVAFDMIEANPQLLAGHPFGTQSVRIDAPGRYSAGAPIGQDWAPVYLEGPPVPPVDPAEVAAEAEGSAVAFHVAAEGSSTAAAIDLGAEGITPPTGETNGSGNP